MSKISKVVVNGIEYEIADIEARKIIKDIAWDSSSNLNDFISAGVYNIKGTRQNAADNLPITNTGADATIAARLIVTVTPEGATTYRHSVGQTLILSDAEGKETKIYTRNGNRTSYDGGISYTIEWSAWATQQTNINVGQVDNLDNLKDNGIYSGVWTKGSYNAYPLTFVCIVINDYFVGVTPRRISQFVYGLSKMDGSVVYQSRVWDDSKSAWGAWEILNKDKISQMIGDEIRPVNDTITTITENLVAMIEAEAESRNNSDVDIKSKAVHYSLYAMSSSNKVNIGGKSVDGSNTISVDIPAATENTAGVMSANDKQKLEASAESFEFFAEKESVGLEISANSGNLSETYIPAATTEKAGVMTAEDKKAVDGIAAAVEEGRKAALRALFIAAGALYNDSDKDIQSKFQYDYYPHKAKHYFLNGIGDLTEEDMLQIYDERDVIYRLNKGRILQGNTGIRTIFTAKIAHPGDLYLKDGSDTALRSYTFSGCSNLERLHFSRIGSSEVDGVSEWDIIMTAKKMQSTFYSCTKLKRISPINVRYTETFENTFRGCSALETVKILNLKANISFSDSPLINKSSLLLMINKSIANSAITITLHADAYATLAEDAEIVAALEAKPLVTLVSA